MPIADTLLIHQNIVKKLDHFIKCTETPNIIFHGSSGSGKRTIVNNFIQRIYNGDPDKLRTCVMYVNCAHGKGIKFVRDELKFFAKTHIHITEKQLFKSIVLLNADNLTIDAQSALRRCIEQFNHTTRFFIVVEDKYKILKPILSRFCEIYVPEPIVDGVVCVNLHSLKIQLAHQSDIDVKKRHTRLKKYIMGNLSPDSSIVSLQAHSVKLYEMGYSVMDLIEILNHSSFLKNIPHPKKYEQILMFNKLRAEIRNEKILMAFVLYFMVMSSETSLVNISFM